MAARNSFRRISRQESECELLKKGIEGNFVVRPSQTNPGDYTLSVKVKQGVTHVRIQHRGDCYDCYGGEEFATLIELVQYYVENPGQLREKNGTVILLTQPLRSEEITSERWFHGGVNGHEAEILLLSKGQHGSYLVRTSTHSPGNFVLTTRVMDEISHIMIQHIDNKFYISNGPQFNTLPELVEYYERNIIVESDGRVVDLKTAFCCTSFLPYHIKQRVSELSKPSDKLYGKAEFEDEYQQIQDDGSRNLYSRKEGGKPENRPRNRFKNIIPFDHTRVILKDPDPSGNTYINANYISGEVPNSKYCYIAAQGCLRTTISDFWSMMWQEKSMVIVMITNEVERGRDKCAHYWPDHKESLLFGRFKITCLNEVVHPCFIVRHFLLNDSRDVFQYQFKAWPDHGVHSNPQDILTFRENINLKMKELIDAGHLPGPLVVHCSAGVGRTGTYIAIDIIIKLIEYQGWEYDIDIQRTVQLLRTQRSGMVQTEDQYRFVYHTIQQYVENSKVKSDSETGAIYENVSMST